MLAFLYELPNQKVTLLTKEVEYSPPHFHFLAEDRSRTNVLDQREKNYFFFKGVKEEVRLHENQVIKLY